MVYACTISASIIWNYYDFLLLKEMNGSVGRAGSAEGFEIISWALSRDNGVASWENTG